MTINYLLCHRRTPLAPLAWRMRGDRPGAPAADAQGEVDISNVAGTVNVSGWDRNEVRVTGTPGRGRGAARFHQRGKRTLIKVVLKKSTHWGDNGDAELSIRVPAGSRLDVNTVSAEISVKRVSGLQRLQSVSGEISTDVAARGSRDQDGEWRCHPARRRRAVGTDPHHGEWQRPGESRRRRGHGDHSERRSQPVTRSDHARPSAHDLRKPVAARSAEGRCACRRRNDLRRSVLRTSSRPSMRNSTSKPFPGISTTASVRNRSPRASTGRAASSTSARARARPTCGSTA